MRLAVLVTCYNRAETSVTSLQRLNACLSQLEDVTPSIFVIDDASPDGTGARLKEALPGLVLGYGDGSLFWNGGMCSAYRLARQRGTFDAYLLFNDDVMVECEGVLEIFSDYRRRNADAPAILVGATKAMASEDITYGGFRRLSRHRPMAVERLEPDGTLRPCDSFNANYVLVPGPFFERIGGLDPFFQHSYGDLDLGYVAEWHGVARYLARRPIGRCDANPPAAPVSGWLDRLQQMARSGWRRHDSLRERSYFLRKHAPFPAAIVQVGAAAAKRLAFRITDSIS